MRLKPLDLVVTIAIVAMNMVWVLLPSHPPVIGIVLALPLVFVLPGYILTEVFFHNRLLDTTHRLILSLGLSLAIDILGGFLLNMFAVGLRAISWVVFLGLLTLVFSLLVAYLRRRTVTSQIRPLSFCFSIYDYILVALAITIAVLSIQYSALSAAQQPSLGFTQLWMLPSAQNHMDCTVRLGIHNFESTSVIYRIAMTVNGTQVNTWPSVVLAPQEQWDRLVPIYSEFSNNVYVEAQLYRLDRPESVYRKVNVTLHITRESNNANVIRCGPV